MRLPCQHQNSPLAATILSSRSESSHIFTTRILKSLCFISFFLRGVSNRNNKSFNFPVQLPTCRVSFLRSILADAPHHWLTLVAGSWTWSALMVATQRSKLVARCWSGSSMTIGWRCLDLVAACCWPWSALLLANPIGSKLLLAAAWCWAWSNTSSSQVAAACWATWAAAQSTVESSILILLLLLMLMLFSSLLLFQLLLLLLVIGETGNMLLLLLLCCRCCPVQSNTWGGVFSFSSGFF